MVKNNILSFFVLCFFVIGLLTLSVDNIYADQQTLRWGSTGSEVSLVQKTLNEKGYSCGPVDGIFGALTFNAVVSFQRDTNINVDGIVGPQTRQALGLVATSNEDSKNNSFTPLQWGSSGQEVRDLQQILNSKGYAVGTVDGVFDERTYNAVVEFQKDAQLTVDGVVDHKTKTSLGLNKITQNSNTRTMVATAYCPCDQCNYPWGGYPSYIGLPLGKGIIAVDPNVIPLGTRLYVEGYGYGVAADTGGAINGNKIDLCFETHEEALRWGIQNIEVTILDKINK
ncbi:Cell wall-binding protein [Candidatus Syntrophocurvum alkaliphilum]|uniref:Cell wall-binding protein n=1 Tax=Candidatus Syntrophocurvum alkaliphilum TaxID=2293317 RepID=A0A6I6D9B1_9FIRM|nr:peptidoglycan-binding protein [Candidatus Syntrophocurvum alkaliphilum]QGT99067.1 Cell wall-binding protein [Candidatus Syntrophocurvum alkaliphilum]